MSVRGRSAGPLRGRRLQALIGFDRHTHQSDREHGSAEEQHEEHRAGEPG